MQLVAYGAQEIYLGPIYDIYFRICVPKFMYHEYLTPEFDQTFNQIVNKHRYGKNKTVVIYNISYVKQIGALG